MKSQNQPELRMDFSNSNKTIKARLDLNKVAQTTTTPNHLIAQWTSSDIYLHGHHRGQI